MTPETPDPPPVSPDPWKVVIERNHPVPFGHALCYGKYEVDAARAADALRHQQELRAAGDRHAETCVVMGRRIYTLEDALSTAEATIDSLRAQIEEKDGTIDAWEITADTLRAERDSAQQENKALEFTNGSMSQAIDIACSGSIASAKEAQTLRESLEGIRDKGCWPCKQRAIAALSPRPQEPQP